MRAFFLACLIVDAVVAFTFLGNIQKMLPKMDPRLKKMLGAPDPFNGNKVCIITGTSSGLGRYTTRWLLENDPSWHVICAVRDTDKMEAIAELDEMDTKRLSIIECDLQKFDSVRNFVDEVKKLKGDIPVDRLVCNAAVYQPSLDTAKYTPDGYEQQLQTNYLSHFLLTSLILPEMREAPKARVIMVGSVTGNDNTVGGGGVYPIADLKEMEGLRLGAREPVSMIDGYNFNGAKAYKDTKLCLMMMANMLHEKYHRATGISFSSIYPGCIAESPLFREKRPWFRKYFPIFMRYITGGFVGEPEAGQRLGQVIVDPRCVKSGVYWSWNGGPREGRGAEAIANGGNIKGAGGAGGDWDSIYENDQSDKVRDFENMAQLWKYTTQITGAVWPLARGMTSPCPTLKVIGAVTAVLDKQQQLTRAPPKSMAEVMGRLAGQN